MLPVDSLYHFFWNRKIFFKNPDFVFCDINKKNVNLTIIKFKKKREIFWITSIVTILFFCAMSFQDHALKRKKNGSQNFLLLPKVLLLHFCFHIYFLFSTIWFHNLIFRHQTVYLKLCKLIFSPRFLFLWYFSVSFIIVESRCVAKLVFSLLK